MTVDEKKYSRGNAVRKNLERRKVPRHHYLLSDDDYLAYRYFLNNFKGVTIGVLGPKSGLFQISFRSIPVYNKRIEQLWKENAHGNRNPS
jgi:hypothetical protein